MINVFIRSQMIEDCTFKFIIYTSQGQA